MYDCMYTHIHVCMLVVCTVGLHTKAKQMENPESLCGKLRVREAVAIPSSGWVPANIPASWHRSRGMMSFSRRLSLALFSLPPAAVTAMATGS